MIPKWKITREIDRLKTQLRAIPLALTEPLRQRRYDDRREHDLRLASGALPASEELAVFLIYQPEGVAASVFQTCAHLVDSGFTPLVISNSPLSEADRAAFARYAHTVVERPNFGYDFGGYRDAIWLIGNLGIKPRQVLFLNDSVWFPIIGESGMLAKMRDASEDYVGTQVFGDTMAKGRKRGFFGSYCFLVKTPLWESEAFQKYWSEYRVSSNKEVTLRRGERAFSRLMLDAAESARALYDLDKFDALVAELDRAALWEAIADMVVTDPGLIAVRDDMMTRGLENTSNKDMRVLIGKSARSKNYIAAAPILAVRELGFPMIKKNNERHYILARNRILQAVDEGRLEEMDPVVLEEIRKSRTN